MSSYIQIDPCVPAVIPSPGSNGGISLDCVSTKTETSTVTQTVQARYINAVSIQANQVSCTDLIVDGKYISNNVKNITADSSSTTINSDLNVTGKTSTQNLICLGDFYVAEDSEIQGNESIDGYLLVKGSGSQFEGSCYFANGIYYNSAPLYPKLQLVSETLSGKSTIDSYDIPSWATSICISFTNLMTTANNGARIQIGNSSEWYTSVGSTVGNKGASTNQWLATTQGVWLINEGSWSSSYMISGTLFIQKMKTGLYSVTGTGDFPGFSYGMHYSGQMYSASGSSLSVDRIQLYVQTSGSFKTPSSPYTDYVSITVQ